MRMAWTDEVQQRRPVSNLLLQQEIPYYVRCGKGRRADRKEVLGSVFVRQQLLARYAHHLDTDAHYGVVVQVGWCEWSGPGEAHPRRVTRRRGEQAVAQGIRQVVAHCEFAAHNAVGLGVPCTLGVDTAGVSALEKSRHQGDDLRGDLGLSGLHILLSETESMVRKSAADNPLH